MNREEIKKSTDDYINKARIAEAAIDQAIDASPQFFREIEDALETLGTPKDPAFRAVYEEPEEQYYRELAEDDLMLGNYESGIPAHRYGADN